jgi:DNA-binding transcriptional MerR regulator
MVNLSEIDPTRSGSAADDRDAVLSIGELSRRTGVGISTLRVWETRHGILRPIRTPGGQRAYREDAVARVQAALDLTQQGWTLWAVARRLDEASSGSMMLDGPPAFDPGEHERPPADGHPPAAAPGDHPLGQGVDVEALLVCHRALRRLLRIATPREGVDIVVALVEEMGGEVGPAQPDDEGRLDVDLSFGEGEPLFPRAEPFTLARMRLEAVLPWLASDARHLIERARLARPPDEPQGLLPEG